MHPQRPNLTKAPVGTTVVDNGMERTVHSHQTMAFPADHQKRLEAMAQARIAQQAAPARPGPNGRRQPVAAMAIPTGPESVTPAEAAAAAYPFAEQPLPQGRVHARHAALHAANAAAAAQHQQPQPAAAPMTAEQHNMRQGPAMGHASILPPPQPIIKPSSPPFIPAAQPEVPNLERQQEEAFEGVPAVENTHPGFTAPVVAGEASSVDLPSRFWAYDFKDLYVTPFVAYHLAKLSRAHEEGSLLPMVEAVSSVLQSSTVQPGVSLAHELTVPDFYFVLYWLKLHSFTKGSYLHTTVCLNPEHHKWVSDGVKPRESLKLQELVTKSQLQVTPLAQIPDMTQFNLGDDSHLMLYPATMRDTLEFLEHPLVADKEFQWLARRASFVRVKPEYQPFSFAERVEAVKLLTPDQIATVERFEKICDSYGVMEKINVRCKECGASRVTKMTLDAHSFLSA